MLNPFRRAAASPLPVPEQKAARPLVALELRRQGQGTARDFGALCREGYARNPIAYRCVRLIAESAASVRLQANDPDVARVLSRGLPGQSAVETFEAFYGYLQVGGTAFLEAVLSPDLDGDERPIAVVAHRPDGFAMGTDSKGRSTGWEQTRDDKTRRFPRDQLSGRSALHNMRLFNPADDCAGLSPLSAAAQAVDLHNRGGAWAKALLENSARPSGALIVNAQGGDRLSDEQFDRLKAELEGNFSGPSRAGRPMVLEGGLDWKSMSLSPADMDFTATRREAARDIALAFGVPPMLLGIPGDNTYANYREANQAFWRQTIIPLVAKTAAGLQDWMAPFFGDDLRIAPDLDRVPALAEERAILWKRLSDASFVTEAEARDIAGLEVAP